MLLILGECSVTIVHASRNPSISCTYTTLDVISLHQDRIWLQACLTLRYWQPDVVVDHVLRGAGVVAGVLEPGVGDGEPDHGGVGGGHPKRVRVRPRHCRGDRNPGPAIRSHGQMSSDIRQVYRDAKFVSLFLRFGILLFTFYTVLKIKWNGKIEGFTDLTTRIISLLHL